MKSFITAFALVFFAATAYADPAADILKKLQAAGLPIGKAVVYNEDNDPNNLMGRPNGYVAKASWADKTISQSGPDMRGGTVEVFANASDLERRRAYIDAVVKAMPMVTQYIYTSGLALLRIDSEVKPSKARAYKEAFQR